MATMIQLSQKTTLPLVKIQEAVSDVFVDLAGKYTLSGGWKKGDVFFFSGQGITGYLTIRGDTVDVKIEIDGLLSAFASIIESHVRQKLHTHLNL